MKNKIKIECSVRTNIEYYPEDYGEKEIDKEMTFNSFERLQKVALHEANGIRKYEIWIREITIGDYTMWGYGVGLYHIPTDEDLSIDPM